MPEKKVYIIIVNYIQWQDTIDCLESISKSTHNNLNVIVVDNNSSNQSVTELLKWLTGKEHAVYTNQEFHLISDPARLAPVTLVCNEVNSGFAAANNIALKLVRDAEGYVCLLNPDMTIEPGTIAELVRFAEATSANTISGAVIRSYHDDQKILVYGGGSLNFNTAKGTPAKTLESARDLDYISGTCLFAPCSHFKQYGLLPESYFLYWEETDWCYQAKLKGAQLNVCPSAICYDKISSVIGKGFLAHYYYCRNGLYFISKFKKKKLPLVLTSMLLRVAKQLVTGQWDKMKGTWRGTMDFTRKRYDAIQ